MTEKSKVFFFATKIVCADNNQVAFIIHAATEDSVTKISFFHDPVLHENKVIELILNFLEVKYIPISDFIHYVHTPQFETYLGIFKNSIVRL